MEKAIERCPFRDECWKWGDGYSCSTTPPFCDEPLIPKTPLLDRARRQMSPLSEIVESILLPPEPEPEGQVPVELAPPPQASSLAHGETMKQGELF